MSSIDASVPLSRPSIPGHRNGAATPSRTPKLGLAIPPKGERPGSSGSNKGLSLQQNSQAVPPPLSIPALGGRGAASSAPKRSLQSVSSGRPGKPQLKLGGLAAVRSQHSHDGSSEESSRSRSMSNSTLNDSTGSTNASSFSTLEFAGMLRSNKATQQDLSPDGTKNNDALERQNSLGTDELPDLEKLSLEMGRPLDVEDLDDAGWKAASKGNRIEELGSLGEGAGGAVTKCRLRGGKTTFALKVRCLPQN